LIQGADFHGCRSRGDWISGTKFFYMYFPDSGCVRTHSDTTNESFVLERESVAIVEEEKLYRSSPVTREPARVRAD